MPSPRTDSGISCIQVMAGAWCLALITALGFFVVFVGNIHEVAAGIATIALMASVVILTIFLATLFLLRGLCRLESWAWYAAVLYLVLHLMGLLAPLALLGLWDIFRLDVQSDFGLARSPVDSDRRDTL